VLTSLLITLREGLEAALIVGIVLGCLDRLGAGDRHRAVWLGVGLAVVASGIVGVGLSATVGGLEGASEQLFEGFAMLTAAAVLTWMIFWMRRHAATIRSELEAGVSRAVGAGSGVGLGVLAFVAVFREGVETALFLYAASRSASAGAVWAGSLVGLGVAVLLGVLLYRGLRVLSLRAVFQVTGAMLVVFAAGVLAHGLHELQEAGIVPVLVDAVWDTGMLLDDHGPVGSFARSLLGYDHDPSLVQVVAWLGYLLAALGFFFRPTHSPAGPS